MSTTEKGREFENIVHKEIEVLLKSKSLGLIPESCKLYQQKGYYSKDRDADIVTDISIELWEPNASHWSLLWVCECKNYKGSIPVDEIEEFKAKVNQITGINVKGIFASASSYQKSALNYAKSNGIGLIRILPDNQVQRVLYQTIGVKTPEEVINSKRREAEIALSNQDHKSDWNSNYASNAGSFYDNLSDFVSVTIKNA